MKTLKPIDHQILRIALPSIVTNITVPLLGIVDLAIVGHMGDAAYIGAIAVGSMVFNVIYWLFGFLRMGTSGMTSQALGRRDLTEVARLLVRSVAVGLAVACCLIVAQRWVLGGALLLVRPSDEVAAHVHTYFNILVWGAPAMLSLYGLTGWYIGMQNTRTPMLVSIVQNIVNIVASLCLVLVCGMKVEGVALGTLTAQYAGLAVAVLMLVRNYSRLRRYPFRTGIFRREAMLRFFTVNRDIFVRTLFLVSVNFFFLSAGASQGTVVLAVNTLLLQFFTFFSYVMDGFAYAGEALCGRCVGAGNVSALRSTVARLFAWGGIMVALYTVAYYLGGSVIVGLLTDDATVVAASGDYYPWVVAIPLAGVAAFVWDGVYIGLTATRQMMVSSVVSAVLFFCVYMLLRPSLANHALWLAFVVYLFSRGAIQTLLYRGIQKKGAVHH